MHNKIDSEFLNHTSPLRKMVRLIPIPAGDHQMGPMPLITIGLFISISCLVALCAKKVSRTHSNESNDSKFVPNKSPLRSPRQLITTISNKAIPFIHHRKTEAEAEAEVRLGGGEADKEGFGEGGLWQKEILMGEKCQPPEFSGVIYYDCGGNRISELPPRSPKASPLPSFSFPATRDEK